MWWRAICFAVSDWGGELTTKDAKGTNEEAQDRRCVLNHRLRKRRMGFLGRVTNQISPGFQPSRKRQRRKSAANCPERFWHRVKNEFMLEHEDRASVSRSATGANSNNPWGSEAGNGLPYFEFATYATSCFIRARFVTFVVDGIQPTTAIETPIGFSRSRCRRGRCAGRGW